MSPHEAIRQACLLRFRPILMTTAAALLAGVPLAFGTGTGSELRQPLGYAMVGGLARARSRGSRWWRRNSKRVTGKPASFTCPLPSSPATTA